MGGVASGPGPLSLVDGSCDSKHFCCLVLFLLQPRLMSFLGFCKPASTLEKYHFLLKSIR